MIEGRLNLGVDLPFPLRCPHCNALVVDRRSPTCTTCQQALPAEWILSHDQVAKLSEIERDAEARHKESMKTLEAIDTHAPRRFPDRLY